MDEAPEADDGTRAAKRQCTVKTRGSGAGARRQCVQSYLEQKASVSATTEPADSRRRCALPSDGMSAKARQDMARCLRAPAASTSRAAHDIDTMLHQHLWQEPLPPERCMPFVGSDSPRPAGLRSCLHAAGSARWTANGLVDANSSSCGRRWMGTAEARCLLSNRDVLFLGNSVVRRQMYTLLDLLAGRAAHRLLANGTGIELHAASSTADAVLSTRLWDLDGHAHGYHAAQLFTIDLRTGRHRFHLPHSELCGVDTTHSNFNVGRHRQWFAPARSLDSHWRSSKWRAREWRPLVSMNVEWPSTATATADACAREARPWAGSYQGSFDTTASDPSTSSAASLASRVRAELLATARARLLAVVPGSAEWLHNVSVHVEAPLDGSGADSGVPNAWVVFPPFHGARETFNGYCGDPVPVQTPCTCSDTISTCTKSPCKGRALCAPLPRGSDSFVDAARGLANHLSTSQPSLLGMRLGRVRVTPLYDDCWSGRDRCQGYRPCHERLDSAYICRSTPLVCPRAPMAEHQPVAIGSHSWPQVLQMAKRWIPSGHPSASLLYIYDGQTQDVADATFKSWGTHTVGYGSHAIVFGPQFATTGPRTMTGMRRSIDLMRSALQRAARCTGHTPLVIFRSPAFNLYAPSPHLEHPAFVSSLTVRSSRVPSVCSDPVNSFTAQASFARRMRPLVEADDFAIFLDNYEATFSAAFPSAGIDPAIGVRFDRNSAFHWLDAGRYLMTNLLLHVLRLLS